MASDNMTYSSAHLRERDQKLIEKFAQEKAEMERKIQRCRYQADETRRDLFDAVNRGKRLARSLGFEDVYDAQVYIDSADFDVSFRDCFDRLKVLEAEVTCEKEKNSILQVRLNKSVEENLARDELELVKSQLRDLEHRYEQQVTESNARYDALLVVKARAAERYKADFKKWRDFSKWLFAEDDEHRKHRSEVGISKEERKKRDLASIFRKRQKMIEIGADLAHLEKDLSDAGDFGTPRDPPPVGRTQMSADKENCGTPLSSATKSQLITPLTNLEAPSSSPTVFLTASQTTSSRKPLDFRPVLGTIQVKQEPTSTPSPHGEHALQHTLSLPPASSETEEESQAPIVKLHKHPEFVVPTSPITSNRRQMGHSQSLPRRPLSTQISRKEPNSHQAKPTYSNGRPSKIRRVNGEEFGPASSSSSTPNPDPRSKVKSKTHDEVGTPLSSNAKGRNRTGDYSIFKGRGRYAGQMQNDEKTVNELFTIDPTQNNGKGYQYDEVVRTREERKKMHGGDCECCREYYENVGPLPPRLQPPLWRSPSKTPSRLHRRRSHSPEAARNSGPSSIRYDLEVDSHRNAISRHRHTWARAKTPPGYWDIGFPNTQEVGDINERAREMQKRKMDEIQKEAQRADGRYRKKQ